MSAQSELRIAREYWHVLIAKGEDMVAVAQPFQVKVQV